MAKAMVVPTMQFPAMSSKASAFLATHANVKPRQTVPTLSPAGYKWTISLNGNDNVLQRKNPETNDLEPIQTMRVFILDYAERRGRAYYVGGYDPEKPGVPVCWSDDGVKPHDKVEVKQHPQCDGCAMSKKGSKVTDNNKAVRACSEHRMLAVVPAVKISYEPLRLKIAITSDWDGKSPDHEARGWHAFSNYMDVLRSLMPSQTHTARVVTKMKFDPNVEFPKILFGVDRASTPEEVDELIEKIAAQRSKISSLISGTFSPNGKDGTRTDEDPESAPAGPANGPKPQGSGTAATAEASKAKIAESRKESAMREAQATEEAAAASSVDAEEDVGNLGGEEESLPGDDNGMDLPDMSGETQAAPAKAAKATPKAANGAAAPSGTKAPAAVHGKTAKAPATAPTPAAAGDAALGALLTDWE